MIIRFLKTYWLLAVIFIVALILRVYNLGAIPVGLHGDEASIGYNAYSLLKTAHDQNGNFLPLVIDQFGDFRPPGYHYLAVPFVALFGLTEFATRLPAAIFGAATIFAFYLLLFEIFGNKRIGLIGAGLLAISPWHIVISRATSEGVIAAFFIILGVYFLIKGYKKKQGFLPVFGLSLLFFLISFMFYHSARFFVPAFVISLLIILAFQYKLPNKTKLLSLGALGILLIGTLYLLLTLGKGDARAFSISIFNSPMASYDIKQQTGEDGTQNPYISRSFHNKLFYYGRLFETNYFQHFDGNFLFVNNGLPIRYTVPWSGNLNLIDLPFLLFGFAVLLTEGIKSKKYLYLIPLAWLFIGAIPAGLTFEDIPNIQRSSLMLYGLLIIIAFGINEMLNIPKKKVKFVLIGIFIIILSHNVIYFTHNYFYHLPIHEPWHRSATSPEIVFTIQELSKDFDTIRMTSQGNNNLIHHLFYSKFDPATFIKMGSPKDEEGLRFGKWITTNHPCPMEGNPETNLAVTEGFAYIVLYSCKLPKNAEIIKVIRHPDGVPAYHVVKLNKPEEQLPQ